MFRGSGPLRCQPRIKLFVDVSPSRALGQIISGYRVVRVIVKVVRVIKVIRVVIRVIRIIRIIRVIRDAHTGYPWPHPACFMTPTV
jgi:hypothetical protein